MTAGFIGREEEVNILKEALHSEQSEMVAVTGRRRVGKTYMIRHVLEGSCSFEMTGMQSAGTATQLNNFAEKMSGYLNISMPLKAPANWQEAFSQLKTYLSQIKNNKKRVVFFDELPWIATARSGFLEAFGYFWNDWASRNNITVVICGSAAGWMINKVVHHKGSLHNRITKLIHLKPFTLYETEQFLKKTYIALNRYQIIQLYMVTGGIPHYLKEIKKGKSVAQQIDKMCFSANGLLKEEFDKLYASLYDKPGAYIEVIRALAARWMGTTRSGILELTGMSDGGSLTRILTELEQSDFILSVPPFNKKKKDILYRLVDNYSLFYLKFMETKRKSGEGSFISLEHTPVWKTWCGYAFENICFIHLQQMKKAMGIGAVYTEAGSYIQKADNKNKGAQVDMLINRADNIINICEMKFYDAPFTITKKYAVELRNKRAMIRIAAPPKKSVFITMVTCFGLQENSYATELIQSQVSAVDLFG